MDNQHEDDTELDIELAAQQEEDEELSEDQLLSTFAAGVMGV